MGETICRLFAKEGAKVVVADYNFEGAEKVASEINTETPDAAIAAHGQPPPVRQHWPWCRLRPAQD